MYAMSDDRRIRKDRRKFIGAGFAAIVGATSLARAGYKDKQDLFYGEEPEPDIMTEPFETSTAEELILPPALEKGSTIAIAAPASPATPWAIHQNVKFFKSIGLKVKYGETVSNPDPSYMYFSDSDENRAADFMNLIGDESVAAIMFARGGYGSMRILPLLDYETIAANPKIIIGFSDATTLLNAVRFRSNMATFHGPVASTTMNSFSAKYFKQALFKPDLQPATMKYSGVAAINPGKASGRLVGGNLSMLVSTLGTKYEIDAKDSILFIEETSEHPYKIDKMLSHLKLAGKFDEASGFVFGYFSKLNSRYRFYPGPSFTIKQVIYSIMEKIGKPTIIGLPIGHTTDKFTLPIGAKAELNADEKYLKLIENSVDV